MTIKMPLAISAIGVALILSLWGTRAIEIGGSVEVDFPGFSLRIEGNQQQSE
ncbi:MAG: hypothetical protein HLUCCA11_23015 [Phormidesmis priestleyi Ana]|uniref:Uncharacterized protein n=1 Tax=Phormidesmis priestleyi Ana TaxID=1666911 RepID=A0A0P7ZQ24_9CYAN|nr:MAG: hypothetical protein HLUCCA11_23015 [Phormidesmis priestleyi Ana]